MNSNLKVILCCAAALLLAPAMAQNNKNQTVTSANTTLQSQQIIDKYLNALGGKEKLEAVKTLMTETTMYLDGMTIPVSSKKIGNKFKLTQNVMGQKITHMFDGTNGYYESMGTKSEVPASTIPQLKKGKVIDALGYRADEYNQVTVETING